MAEALARKLSDRFDTFDDAGPRSEDDCVEQELVIHEREGRVVASYDQQPARIGETAGSGTLEGAFAPELLCGGSLRGAERDAGSRTKSLVRLESA